MADDGQELQQASARYEQVQRRLQALDRHLQSLEESLSDAQAALETLNGLEGEGEKETLVPIGAGVRLGARVDASRPLMVALGGDYHAELPLADARTRLQERLERIQGAYRSSSQEAERLGAEAQRLTSLLMQQQG